MSKYGLDKFYTKDEISIKCLKEISNINSYKTIIEPSAGDGSFSEKINNCIAFDIQPENENIFQADFLKKDLSEYESPILIIGNPPFGRNGSLALKFIKHSAKFADTIAFILPKSFKKQSLYDKIPLNFWKIYEKDIPNDSFLFEGKTVDIPCVFQIYEKRKEKRKKEKIEQSDFFSFVKKEEANVSIRRVGVYSGKASLDLNKSKQSHYFIKTDNPREFVDIVNSIHWEHNNTVGARSISKPELIKALLEVF